MVTLWVKFKCGLLTTREGRPRDPEAAERWDRILSRIKHYTSEHSLRQSVGARLSKGDRKPMGEHMMAIDVDGDLPELVSYTHFCMAYADAFFGEDTRAGRRRRNRNPTRGLGGHGAAAEPDASVESEKERANKGVRSRLPRGDGSRKERQADGGLRAPLLQSGSPRRGSSEV